MDKKKEESATVRIDSKDLDQTSGGTPGIAVPGRPNTPYVTSPGDYPENDKPKDGGATGSW